MPEMDQFSDAVDTSHSSHAAESNLCAPVGSDQAHLPAEMVGSYLLATASPYDEQSWLRTGSGSGFKDCPDNFAACLGVPVPGCADGLDQNQPAPAFLGVRGAGSEGRAGAGVVHLDHEVLAVRQQHKSDWEMGARGPGCVDGVGDEFGDEELSGFGQVGEVPFP